MPQHSPNTSLPPSAGDLAQCYASLRHGSRTFFAASFLLPKALRAPAAALYAFCRMADDEIDLGEAGDQALERLQERLDRAYSQCPLGNSVDRAFSHVVKRYAIPRALPQALLEGFAWDRQRRQYQSIDDLCDYAARVAGTVGAMMSLLMGARAPATVARACDLGVAMQLTNIARDVGEDAQAGRLYLPLDWMRETGLDPEKWLVQPVYCDEIGNVIARILSYADELYARATVGVGQLPWSCRPAIHAARILYAEIGREVERRGCDSVNSRAVVSKSRKARLLLNALAVAALPSRANTSDALHATGFLVDAVAALPLREPELPLAMPSELAWWDLGSRIEWTLQLFERLEQRHRVGGMSGDT